MKGHFLARSAQRDIDGNWEHIAADNERMADRFVGALCGKFNKLADSPYLGASCDHYGPGFRYFPFRNYVIYYRLFDKRVQILRVLHGAQDHDAEFGVSGQ